MLKMSSSMTALKKKRWATDSSLQVILIKTLVSLLTKEVRLDKKIPTTMAVSLCLMILQETTT